jgi:tRNA A-37 threonylcarbamoyl transferase component Bud32
MAFSLKDYVGMHKIAEGGMGNVYVATQVSLERKVVIKELSLNVRKDAKLLKRFENEAKSAAALDHENIIQVFDFGEDNGSFYISMEYLDGWDLEKLLHWDPFPKEIGLMVLLKAFKGLNYAHHRGTTHRDVKPGNILVSKAGKVKVVDFGLAHAGAQDFDFDDASSVFITPGYMPPEVANGIKAVSPSMDIWSAGVVAYKIVTGRLPFAGDTVRAMAHAVVNDKEKDIQELCPTLPDDCAESIRMCLRKDPRKRPASLDGLTDALSNYLYELGVRDVESMVVGYIEDKERSFVDLAALLSAYHLRKGNDWIEAGDTAKSDLHFREAERFGVVGMLGAGPVRRQAPPLRPADTVRRALPPTRRGAILGAGGLKRWGTKAAITAAGIFGIVVLGTTSVSMMSRKNPGDVAVSRTLLSDGSTRKTHRDANVGAAATDDSAAKNLPPGYGALNHELTPVGDFSKETGEGRALRETKRSALPRPAAAVPRQAEAQYGTLRVSVDPPQAVVFLDGKILAPDELFSGKSLRKGAHALSVAATGYKSLSMSVTIDANVTRVVPVSLKAEAKAQGLLHVYSYPWADVYVDGMSQGTSPTATPITLPEGDHAVLVKREGFKPYSSTVHVVGGQIARLKIQLEAQTQTAEVKPGNATE